MTAERTPAVEVNRDRLDADRLLITRGTEKLGHVSHYTRGSWDCNAWVEGDLHQWSERTKDEAIAAVIRTYQPWTLEGAYGRLAAAQERVDETREPLHRLDDAARDATAARDAAYREHVAALARAVSLQRSILDELKP